MKNILIAYSVKDKGIRIFAGNEFPRSLHHNSTSRSGLFILKFILILIITIIIFNIIIIMIIIYYFINLFYRFCEIIKLLFYLLFC